MATDLGFRLKEHFYKMLVNNLSNEISYQIEDVWGAYFDRLIVAQDSAMKNQAQALKDAERAQEEYEKRQERAFAVFNFFKGLALLWVGAQLQYRVLNQYFKRKDWIQEGDLIAGNFTVKMVESEDKVATKVFGDIGKDVVGTLGTLGLQGRLSPRHFQPPDTSAVAKSTTLESLRTNLKDVIRTQKNNALGAIADIANGIENDVDFGDKLVDALDVTSSNSQKESLSALEQRGQRAINTWMNTQRVEWSKKWQYYGNNPPSQRTHILSNHMEKEMWVLWMLENRRFSGHTLTDIQAGRLPWIDSIMERMFYLNLPTTDFVMLDDGPKKVEALEKFILWCWKHKPDDPEWSRMGTTRDLTPIETWSRPH